ncbi:DNA transfer protein [Dinoroseobacter phage vB_DshS-R5C]|uniref:DNA transfer protein n=1 Tax=Dinoroseobacter phage vB_DshS-R5C TaxID=1965368 RepID=A0A1V0DY84_9CAUD|nr:DNA transfer protein [Dinoroseobacter phage vB_DshS-R5C]ARB06109.1 DNA transfer protein [Dinoroseobacter phage vB_DshS-R5C]
MPKQIDYTPEEVFDAFQRLGRSQRAVSRELGISRGAVKYRLEKAAQLGMDYDAPISGGKFTAFKTIVMPLPKVGEVKRYILSSIQNNTDAHVPFVENLVAYAEHIGAEFKVARYSYNRAAYGNKGTKAGKGPTEDDTKELWFDPIFDEYICDDRLELAPQLLFCGEMNISPTAKRPLSSLETYAGRKSAIFPHTKFALESIAGTANEGAKFNYTTGTATLLNYIQKKQGLQAEFHHGFGAVIVEVDHEGDWFVRQLNADNDGTFYDITPAGVVRVSDGEVSSGAVAAINWGDIHAEVVDPEIYELSFADGGILDTLRPSHQFAHDVLDFRARNHHEIKNCHQMFKRWREGTDNVRDEVHRVKALLEDIDRDFCTTVIVDSNHDRALERWLREADYKTDPENAVYFLERQLAQYRAIENDDQDYHALREALRDAGLSRDFLFLGPDDSFVLCNEDDEFSGGVEFGMHGHLGPNGSRGTPLGLSRLGRKANTGHTHSAQIIDGLYVAGTMSKLRLDYNSGPSSWSHSFIVTYENGKRTIITCYNGKWRAGP